MRLTRVELRNFKRFTHLTLAEIPTTAKLVLLIGANGSGKSSVFDAFEFLIGAAKTRTFQAQNGYYRKTGPGDAAVLLTEDTGKTLERIGDQPASSTPSGSFYGRSSIRIVPRAVQVLADDDTIRLDLDGPTHYIEPDTRFNSDVQLYVETTDRRFRALLSLEDEGEVGTKFGAIRAEQIAPLNASLARVFGDDPATGIQLVSWEGAKVGAAPILEFSKGASRITYDLLSHGEKQVVILLLNFMVRREHLENTILFIDEMDNHMHRSLQYRLLEEIVSTWIPDSSQLWTASHALGFIEFARDSPDAATFDFDELDFDVAQELRPVAKDDPDVFEIAIGRELIAELATTKKIVLIEGNDRRYFDRADLNGVAFLKSENKQHAFAKAQSIGHANVVCLLDRDFLTEAECARITAVHPFVRFLPTCCVENELWHPDNVAAALGTAFDSDAYRTAWIEDMEQSRCKVVASLERVRQTYGFFFEPDERKAFVAASVHVAELLRSTDFDAFYPVFSAKDHGRAAKATVTVTPDLLASTERFRSRVATAIGVPVTARRL